MGLENFRKNLRYLRKKHGFSQPFIAEICNKKSYTTIQKWETGDAEPSLKEVAMLAEMYNVNIDDFVKIDLEQAGFNALPPSPSITDEDASLLADFHKLNSFGQEKAADYINDLTENPKYTEKELSISTDTA